MSDAATLPQEIAIQGTELIRVNYQNPPLLSTRCRKKSRNRPGWGGICKKNARHGYLFGRSDPGCHYPTYLRGIWALTTDPSASVRPGCYLTQRDEFRRILRLPRRHGTGRRIRRIPDRSHAPRNPFPHLDSSDVGASLACNLSGGISRRRNRQAYPK